MTNTTLLLTAADLTILPTSLLDGDVWYELKDGVPIPNAPQSGIQSRSQVLAMRHLQSVESSGQGKIYGRVGIILRRNPDRVVGPAISVLFHDQHPIRFSPEDFLVTIPKLVVEIRSKNDTLGEIESKVAEYLAAGVVEVWVLDPEDQSIAKHTVDEARVFATADKLTSDLLPSFHVPVAEFFVD